MKILQIKLLLILFLFSSLIHAQENPPVIVDEMPRFPGCEDIESTQDEKKRCAEKKMLTFLYKNIKYPEKAKESGIEGMVVVSFIIEKDGKITSPMILRDLGGGCGKEALRVVNAMPQWIPGKEKGEEVRVQFNLPVRFKLEAPKPAPNANLRKKPLHLKLRNNSMKIYGISTPDGWVILASKSDIWIKVYDGYQVKWRKDGKEEHLVKAVQNMHRREINVHKTIKKDLLYITRTRRAS